MYWSTIAHQRAIGIHDEQREKLKRFESSGWKSPYQSEADAIEQAHRLADGYNRQSLRVLRQLRDLRRYAPVVIKNTWTVMAVVDGKEIVSPGPSAPEMKFQILSMSNLKELNQLKRTRSHLALGVFYTRVGMIAEAEREFQKLLRLNPNSKAVGHLLRSFRLVRQND
jgi:hypothetical protein